MSMLLWTVRFFRCSCYRFDPVRRIISIHCCVPNEISQAESKEKKRKA
jgi:hypothetical protein